MSDTHQSLTRTTTINDVARNAGVSVRTVSRVLNRSPKVGEATRLQVERVITELKFKPSLRARGLASRRSFLLGIVQGNQNSHVVGVLQQGVVEVCSEAGYELLVHPVSTQDVRLAENLEDFVLRTRVDGLVLLSPVSEIPSLPALLNKLRVPTVGIAAVRVPGYSTMLVTGERVAAGAIVDHLIGLGHRRIAMITGPRHFYSAIEREQGFRIALQQANVALPAAYVREGDYEFGSGLAAAADLLTLDKRPTAIFASNDVMAAAVLKIAREMRLPVPEELSVAGFDDSDIASMISPSLTTIRRPLKAIAREATRRLIAMAEDEIVQLSDQHVELSLVVRQSTGRIER